MGVYVLARDVGARRARLTSYTFAMSTYCVLQKVDQPTGTAASLPECQSRAPCRLSVLAATTAIALALAISPAAAQQVIIIDDAQTTTNGGATIDGDDSLTVTESGSITTVNDNAIETTGDDNVIDMRGDLSTIGAGAHGFAITGNGNVVTSFGTVTIGHVNSDGFVINGDANTITNSGLVTTVGDAFVIQSGTGNTITNSGTIIAGSEAFEIESDGNTVINSGTLIVGREAFDINSSGNTIINTADVTVDAAPAFDIDGGDNDNVIVNSGAITTTGNSSEAFEIGGERNFVTNSGAVRTEGVNAGGVDFLGIGNQNNTFENSGSIFTLGTSAEGIEVSGDQNTVTNSGSIVAVNSDTILVRNNADGTALNLLAPGFLGGAIDLRDSTNTTVNIVTGPSQSIFWTLDTDDPTDLAGNAPNLSGSVPFFYNAATQTVATFDPTLLASESQALGDLTRLLSRVGLGAVEGFGAGFGSGSAGPLAYQPGESYPAGVQATERAIESDVGHRFGRVWVTVLGGQMDHDGGGTTLDSTIGHFGFAGGTTWQHTPGTTLSAMAGYVAGSNEADAVWAPSFDHDTHTLFASLHGEHQLSWGTFGSGALQFGLTAGYSQIDHNRFVNDNLAPLGESWVSADYGGFFVSPELGFSTDFVLESGQTLTPNAGLRYAAQWLDGYTETGAVSPAANATVEDRFVGALEARAGLDVTRNFAFGTLTGRIGYLGRWSTGDDGASITLNGVTQTVASDVQNLNAVTIGATLRSALGETAFLELDANYLVGDTAQGFDGRITVGMAF